MKKYIYIFFINVLFCSCSNRNYIPSEIIKPGKMQEILWDMLRADALAQEIVRKDSSKKIKGESDILDKNIFSIYHIDRPTFESSILYYQKHPALLKTIFDSISAKQSKKKPQEMDKFKQLHKKIIKPV